MARLIPAKPRGTQKQQEFIAEVQQYLSDEFIIFQTGLGDGVYLIGAPGRRWRILPHFEDGRDYIRSTGEVITTWGSIDSRAVIAEALAVAKDLGIDNPVCEHLYIEWEKDCFKMLRNSGSEMLPGMAKLTKSVSEVFFFSRSGPVTADDINDVLQTVSKLASEYVPGRVTKAQAEWRKKLLEPNITPFGPEDFIEKDKDVEWPPFSTLDDEISFDGKDEIIKLQNSEILFLRTLVSKFVSQRFS